MASRAARPVDRASGFVRDPLAVVIVCSCMFAVIDVLLILASP